MNGVGGASSSSSSITVETASTPGTSLRQA